MIKADGTVWVYGAANVYDKVCSDWRQPKMVIGISDAIAIHGNYLVKSDGTVWQINENYDYNMSSDQCDFENVEFQAAQVSGLSDISEIYSWGDYLVATNSSGSVFVASFDDVRQIAGLDQIQKIQFKRYNNTYLGVVLKFDGSVWTFSVPESNLSQLQTQKISSLKDIVEINNSFAIDENGDLWGWDESIIDSSPSIIMASSPTKVQTSTKVSSVNEAYGQMVAVFDNGSVGIWGYVFQNNALPCLNGTYDFYYGDITDYPWLTGCSLDNITIPLPTVVQGVSVFL